MSCFSSKVSSSIVVEIMKAAYLPLLAMKVGNTGEVLTWSSCGDILCLTPSNIRCLDGWEGDMSNCREEDKSWHPRPQYVF